MILSVSRYASSTHSTILPGCGEYSSSMLTVRLNPVSRIARMDDGRVLKIEDSREVMDGMKG